MHSKAQSRVLSVGKRRLGMGFCGALDVWLHSSMSGASTSVVQLSARQIRLAADTDPDFGTARLRLPASEWTAAGVSFHKPVCLTLETGGCREGEGGGGCCGRPCVAQCMQAGAAALHPTPLLPCVRRARTVAHLLHQCADRRPVRGCACRAPC